jgi:hypothetical protein
MMSKPDKSVKVSFATDCTKKKFVLNMPIAARTSAWQGNMKPKTDDFIRGVGLDARLVSAA